MFDSFYRNCYIIFVKPIRFDRHARRRMKEREITEEEAKITIKEPEYTEPSAKGRTNAFKFISNKFLRVTFKEEYDHILVITVTMRKKPFKE
ncbi:MAG: DUF4258 domain-containing protein [Nitrospirota bacterium]